MLYHVGSTQPTKLDIIPTEHPFNMVIYEWAYKIMQNMEVNWLNVEVTRSLNTDHNLGKQL